MKVTIVDSSTLLATREGGSSLMTHNTKAAGADEPARRKLNEIHHLES